MRDMNISFSWMYEGQEAFRRQVYVLEKGSEKRCLHLQVWGNEN